MSGPKTILFMSLLLCGFICALSAEQPSAADKNDRVEALIRTWANVGIFKWSGRKEDSLILVKQIKGIDKSELVSSSNSIHRMLIMARPSKPRQLIIATKHREFKGDAEMKLGASMYGINADGETVFISEKDPKIRLMDLMKLLANEQP
jgi:hypothetical protein